MGLVREISIGKHKDAPRYLQTALTDGSAVKSSQYTLCNMCRGVRFVVGDVHLFSSEVFTIHTVHCATCAVVCDVQLFIARGAMVQLMQGLVGRGQR